MFFGEINNVNAQLVLEIYIASFFLSYPIFDRKKGFIWKYLLLTVIFITLGYFFPTYWDSNPFLTTFYWTFMYGTLLLFSLPALLLCFKMNFYNAVLVCLSSYLIHHINNIFASIFTDSISMFTNIDGIPFQIIKWSIAFVSILFTYFIFFHFYRLQRKASLQLTFNNKQLVFFAFVVIIFTIIISSGVRVFYYVSDIKTLFLIGLISNFASCLILVILFFFFLKHNHIQQELEIEKRLMKERKEQYELSKENIDSLNIKFHDLKYRVALLTSSNEAISKDSLKDIYRDIDVYEALAKTGNKALDIVLTQYALRSENNHIKFTSIADGKALSFMSDYDIYVLFGNAITNAIEATSKLENEEKRLISLIMKRKGNVLYIELENFFKKEDFIIKNGLLQTSKSDKEYHGFGMKSMENIVHKYDGVMSFKIDNDIFHLLITFTLKDENTTN